MKKIILLAMTVYAVLAPLTYHPDTKLTLYYATLGKEKVWDIYSYLALNKNDAPGFHYPPMNFWILKIELPLVKLVGGRDVESWLGIGSNIAFLDKNIFLYNLATKLPILLMILVTGLVIYRICLRIGCSENRSRMATLIWLLNPITLFSGVIMGQNDILAILPFVVGLYWYYQNPILAFMLFGLGGSIKSFPLIWAVALAGVYPTKNLFKKIGLMLIPFGLYGLTILPFLKYDYFVRDVMNSGLAMRMFEMTVGLGLGIKLMVVPTLLVVITLLGMKNNMGKNYGGICKLLVAINFAILGFSNFNPQWFIWIMPFLSVLLVMYGGWWILLLTTVSLMGVTLLFDDKFLYWGLVSPINPNLINLPYVSELLKSININPLWLNNLFHRTITGISFYWLFVCAKFKK